MGRSRRTLAALLLTDMVGFSALAQQDERGALRLVQEQERLIRPVVLRHAGRVVKTLGDGVLAEFPSALDAVTAAQEILRATERRNSVTDREPIRLRIGVHLGDVVRRGRDVLGDAVNIVSRIEPLAVPGGVCLSQQVADQVRNKIPAELVPLGTPRLKNISAAIPLYALSGPPIAKHEAVPAPELPRVAVLPLSNFGGPAEDEYFADGITEELIQTLSKIVGLRVIGRTSVMRFKRSNETPAEIARDLGATAIVEGSFRRAGARIRVTARLLNPSTAETLWAGEYDRADRDILTVQSDISERVARALEVEILGGRKGPLRPSGPANTEAYTFYLKGRHLLNQRTSDSLRQALDCFRAAIQRDPGMAQAHAGAADAYSTMAWLEFARPRFAFPRARASAVRAVALDPALAEALASLGFVQMLYDGAWTEAERSFRRAIELNPSYPAAHQYYADLLKAAGRFDEAEAEVRRALELDPLSLGIHTALGHVLYLARRYDDAIAQYRRALELDPGFAQAHLWFGRPYLEKGRFDRAITEVRTAVRLTHESTMSLAVLGHALASAGRTKEARAILRRLRQRSRSEYVPAYWIGLIYVGLSEDGLAIQWLTRAARDRSAWLTWIRVEPRFDRLRADARFSKLVSRIRRS